MRKISFNALCARGGTPAHAQYGHLYRLTWRTHVSCAAASCGRNTAVVASPGIVRVQPKFGIPLGLSPKVVRTCPGANESIVAVPKSYPSFVRVLDWPWAEPNQNPGFKR